MGWEGGRMVRPGVSTALPTACMLQDPRHQQAPTPRAHEDWAPSSGLAQAVQSNSTGHIPSIHIPRIHLTSSLRSLHLVLLHLRVQRNPQAPPRPAGGAEGGRGRMAGLGCADGWMQPQPAQPTHWGQPPAHMAAHQLTCLTHPHRPPLPPLIRCWQGPGTLTARARCRPASSPSSRSPCSSERGLVGGVREGEGAGARQAKRAGCGGWVGGWVGPRVTMRFAGAGSTHKPPSPSPSTRPPASTPATCRSTSAPTTTC